MKPTAIAKSCSGSAGLPLGPKYRSSSSPSSPSFSSSSKYKGVRKRKWGKWVSEIRLPNSRERIWLGSYDSPEKAARAFDAALFCLRGRNAKFNFPSSYPDIPNAHNLTPQEIQVVAAQFANEHIHGCTPDEADPSVIEEKQPHHGSQESNMDWSFLGALDEIGRRDSDIGFLYGYGEIGSYYGTHHRHDVGDRDNDDDDDGDGNGNGAYYDGRNAYQSSFLWNF